jgi:hypothetical protein
MERAGLRYKNLASRCRRSADASTINPEKAALLRMADAYDRRAEELEAEWQRAVESAKQPDLPLHA